MHRIHCSVFFSSGLIRQRHNDITRSLFFDRYRCHARIHNGARRLLLATACVFVSTTFRQDLLILHPGQPDITMSVDSLMLDDRLPDIPLCFESQVTEPSFPPPSYKLQILQIWCLFQIATIWAHLRSCLPCRI